MFPPSSILADKAHMAICKACCDALIIPKRSRRLPMFTKADVQRKAGYPFFNARRWDDIIEAVEKFDWRELQELDGTRTINFIEREKPLQLLGLSAYAFRSAHYEIAYQDESVADNEIRRRTVVAKVVNPRDELLSLASSDWDDTAQRIASRFLAQDNGKRTMGYGSVEIAGGRLAWRWLETVGKRIENRRSRFRAVENQLITLGLPPPNHLPELPLI